MKQLQSDRYCADPAAQSAQVGLQNLERHIIQMIVVGNVYHEVKEHVAANK